MSRSNPLSDRGRPANGEAPFDMDEYKASLRELPAGGRIVLERDDVTGIATLIIDNPRRRNAIDGHMMVELHDAVGELERWSAGKGVLLRGTGGTFCSGADLTVVRTVLTPEQGGHMYRLMTDSLNRLFALPLVSVALVEGFAVGGGAEVATACDFRLMTPGARLGFVQRRMGITAAWGAGARLVQLVGRTAALDLLATARVMTPEEARGMGLVSDVIPQPAAPGVGGDGENAPPYPLGAALRWLGERTQGSVTLARAQKLMVLNACGVLLSEEQRAGERAIMESVWGGPDQFQALEQNLKHKAADRDTHRATAS